MTCKDVTVLMTPSLIISDFGFVHSFPESPQFIVGDCVEHEEDIGDLRVGVGIVLIGVGIRDTNQLVTIKVSYTFVSDTSVTTNVNLTTAQRTLNGTYTVYAASRASYRPGWYRNLVVSFA